MKWDEKTFGRFIYISNLSISNDGKKIAFAVTKANFDKDKYESTVVVKDTENEGEKYIKNAKNPVLSPCGGYVVFVRHNEKEKKQVIYIAETLNMSERKLAEFENVNFIKWSPSGEYLLVATQETQKDEHMIFINDVPPWFDGIGFLPKRKLKLRVIDLLTGEELHSFESEIFTSAVWHGNNKIVYSVPRLKESLFAKYDTFVCDLESGKVEKIFENMGLRIEDSNGSFLLFHGKPNIARFSEHRYLYLYNGKELTSVTEKFVYNNVLGRIDERGRVFFSSDEKGKITLKVVEPDLSIISEDESWVTEFAVSKDGKVVFLKETEASPAEVYLWSGKVKKITKYNDKLLEKLKPQRAKYFSFKSEDLDIDGWYMKPAINDGDKAPVVLFVHGGPKGMYGYRFNYTMQLLVNSGFYVVYFNPRGSTGYDEDFALRVLGRTGKEDLQDIITGLEEFFKIEPSADKERVGITGISYGGFMTNWAVTQTEFFKAAVSENGVSNWLNMYGVSDISLVFVKEIIGDDPLRNELYKELSPVFHVKNVKTPILLIHSLEDYRCPLDQSVMFYNILKDHGKEAYIAIFKKGAHGHSLYGSPKHRAKRYKLIKEFFVQKLIEGKNKFEFKESEKNEEKT